jgi:two-component system heavy metal sensor histidine kinase CusS
VALARTRTPAEYIEVLSSFLEDSVRLSELIESLLFLARSESPGDHLNKTEEHLGQLLTDLCDYYDAMATERGVKLTATGGDDIVADVDRALLQQALGNLVLNALAHCSPGDQIWLGAQSLDGQIRLEIRDSGSGISAEALPHVFDRFYRADPARSRNSGGAGLGLAIVKQIVLLHGGDVQIASEPGRGTTVTVVLPQLRTPTGVGLPLIRTSVPLQVRT